MKRSLHSYAATLLATATLLLAFTSQNLMAQCSGSGDPFGGGDGSSGNPFQICSIDQLNRIRNSGGNNYLDDHFVLTKDLDFLDTDESGTDYVYSTANDAENAKGWLPIGHDTNAGSTNHQGTYFTGSFDGDDHVILNLRINRVGEDYVGLFGRVDVGVDCFFGSGGFGGDGERLGRRPRGGE